jgi:hypothetical protein
MSKRDPEEMKKRLAANRLKKRTATLVGLFASLGVSVSPVAHDRYWLLLDRLRGGRSWPLQWTDDLPADVQAFIFGSDLVTILGWSVDEEPALLVSAEKVLAKVAALNHIYPDGFVLINDAGQKALLVDFDDDEGTHVNVVDLPRPPA